MMFDAAGLDLFVAGECVLSASFDALDLSQLQYELLPEDWEVPETYQSKFITHEGRVNSRLVSYNAEELEYQIRVFLTALARKKGYEIK